MILMVTLVPDILAPTGPVPAWPGLIRSTTGPDRPADTGDDLLCLTGQGIILYLLHFITIDSPPKISDKEILPKLS